MSGPSPNAEGRPRREVVAAGARDLAPAAARSLAELVRAVARAEKAARLAAWRMGRNADERARYARNRSDEAARVRNYYERNREARKAYARRRYREKRERILQRVKAREVGVPVAEFRQ